MKKICIVTTMWSSINNWVKPFLNEYHNRNIDVTIVCNMDESFRRELCEQYPFVHAYPIPFPRGISFLGSLNSIHKLFLFFKKNHFDLVQYSTPNASMYSAVASKMAGIPVRLYCQWGMVYVTMSGLKRMIFRSIEKMVCSLSTNVQPDSEGNLIFCRKEGFYNEEKSCVIWNGSAKGIDLTTYDISKKAIYCDETKKKYGIQEDTPVVGFVGRLGREKGCNELFKAFIEIKKSFPSAKLLFVGPIEKENSIEPELLKFFWECDDIIKTDRISNVEKYISAMDVFVLPSYREGFGMSVVEASAMGVPVITTKYPGPSSAMKEGVSGYSVSVKDVEGLIKYIELILSNRDLAEKLGAEGRNFVEGHFEQREFIRRFMENREQLLGMNH